MSIDSLVSRSYQDELAARARERNAILAMETGAGKTMISAIVIKWKLLSEKMKRGDDASLATKKVALFLVPKVPLVHQQRAFLEKNLPFEIRGYTGAMGVDGWDRTAWQTEFKEADVLVMTSQIFLNILRHAHWTIAQVAIIVFDEIHNLRGRSPEAQIMNEHYHTVQDVASRPRIIGLTASPIFNVKQPVTALQEMERISDCKVFVVRENTQDLARFTFQAEDKIINYPATPSQFPLYDHSSLWKELHAKKLLPNDLLFPNREHDAPESSWYRALKIRYESSFSALGPFGADLFLLVHMRSSLDTLAQELPMVIPPQRDPKARQRKSIDETKEVLEEHQVRLATIGDVLPHDCLSPKLLQLKQLLLEQEKQNFRGIIFTYERQVATTISLMLPRLGIPGIRGGPIVGHGQRICSEPTEVGMKGMSFKAQENILEEFRKGTLNLLVATSVAEEGLDFPECSFVCRFDPPMTLPQYIQSRGRARKAGSTFLIMLENGPSLARGRVEALQQGEVRVKDMYGKNMERADNEVADFDDGVEDPSFEGRYVVESTGASLTPAGAISLLNNLCSLIPRDHHTPPLQPRYNIHPVLHTCEVRLPAALPIPEDAKLVRGTPFSKTKKAAKRTAAFNAVIKLYELGVFDDYLLPIRREKGDTAEDIDGKPPIDVTSIEPMMDISVLDPWGDVWQQGAPIYLHKLDIPGRHSMGLVCANNLGGFTGEILVTGEKISLRLETAVPVGVREEVRRHNLTLMDNYTKHGIRCAITRKGLQVPSAIFLVPLDAQGMPDWEEMEHIAHTPASGDWRAADFSKSRHMIVSLKNDSKPSQFVKLRPDLSAAEVCENTPFLSRFLRSQAKIGISLPPDDILLECLPLVQSTSTEYRDPSLQKSRIFEKEPIFLPQSMAQWINISTELIEWFLLLPPLTAMLTGIYRARTVQGLLNTPGLDLSRTVEALTLPSANASFNNQRLETLGDAFLKVATSVHVFNKYPHKHEGQLSVLRQNSVCNRYLLGRGHAQDLEVFMNVEVNNVRKWRIVTGNSTQQDNSWMIKRLIPRRSVQDCMEALLGAAWLSGGLVGGLTAGTRLGLCFGGEDPWHQRYPQGSFDKSLASPFPNLELALGYTFQDKTLLIEALTHPSFSGAGSSYQRLEFLGDAIFDLVTMDYFFHKFPTAPSGKLTRARARCIRNPTLAAIATKKLMAHKLLLCDLVSLQEAMNKTAEEYAGMSFEEIMDQLWRLDAPKALGDIIESLLGAVLVDSGWNYQTANRVALKLLEDVLPLVHPEMAYDPTTEFLLWVGRYGCTQVRYRKESSSKERNARKDQIFVVVHGVDVGPATYIQPKTTSVLARAMASLKAKALLEDPMSDFSFEKMCNCSSIEKKDNTKRYKAGADLASDEADMDPDTEAGFATKAQNELARDGYEHVESDADEREDSLEVEDAEGNGGVIEYHDDNMEM